ncbi:Hsk1-interacting molecule 1 [Leucoagaricus sp. SymC.cos]|nr:Hsk1-interacting molecule 1 [Leucoagaricus sp. SymC.cos]
MAGRQPLAPRSTQPFLSAPSPVPPLKSVQIPKRPRSPDSATHNLESLIKRHKPAAPRPNLSQNAIKKERNLDQRKIKEQQRTEREQQRLEFKEKYCRAFPTWRFYLDLDLDSPQFGLFQSRIQQLGGKLVPFFSCNKDDNDTKVTHLISNRPLSNLEKENMPKYRVPPKSAQKSPLKTRTTRVPDDSETKEQDIIAKALSNDVKIWNTIKLESVLARCLEEPSASTTSSAPNSKQRNPNNLSKLLQSERVHGLSERDPTQKRHDFRYFTRGSYFVLVEDMFGELSTIAAHEYPARKEREGEKTPWPTLYCHPKARGPFILYDDKEKRRWERLQQAEEKESQERRARCEIFVRRQLMEKKTEPRIISRKAGDLRRSVSMNNMRNATHKGLHDIDGDTVESATPSGYLASGFMGYMAASGNSVGITSTAGTTSTANYTSRTLQVPSNLSGRIRQEVVMRRHPQEKLVRTNTMGPPVDVPQRPQVLKKSKSTNTLKLPKREEGSKPGYCESCRQKFEDFKEHINGRRHRKFAEDINNFEELDDLLGQVQRRTLQERQAEEKRIIDICRQLQCQESDSDSIL